MSDLSYHSGEAIQPGDHIRYDGETGHIDFVVTEKSGDRALDWFLEQFPGGGVMVIAEGFGRVFLDLANLDDQLEFVARASGPTTGSSSNGA
jgi:hypothetical protein